jgi:hypothetical protein
MLPKYQRPSVTCVSTHGHHSDKKVYVRSTLTRLDNLWAVQCLDCTCRSMLHYTRHVSRRLVYHQGFLKVSVGVILHHDRAIQPLKTKRYNDTVRDLD